MVRRRQAIARYWWNERRLTVVTPNHVTVSKWVWVHEESGCGCGCLWLTLRQWLMMAPKRSHPSGASARKAKQARGERTWVAVVCFGAIVAYSKNRPGLVLSVSVCRFIRSSKARERRRRVETVRRSEFARAVTFASGSKYWRKSKDVRIKRQRANTLEHLKKKKEYLDCLYIFEILLMLTLPL